MNNNNGVNGSNGVNRSNGVNGSHGVNWSEGVNGSHGVNRSDGVNRSHGVNWSEGVNGSNGVNRSDGVNRSYGVNGSYGVLNSYGVDREIFCVDKKRVWKIFGIEVSKVRFDEVWKNLNDKLGGWYPKPHTMFELYKANGKVWADTPVSEVKDTLTNNDPTDEDFDPYPMWKDMPQGAVDYLKSLPEFDSVLFKRVTGIDTNEVKGFTMDEVAKALRVEVSKLRIKK